MTACPNCKSQNFIDTDEREFCPDCGIECDHTVFTHAHDPYPGMNEAYKAMIDRWWEEENQERSRPW